MAYFKVEYPSDESCRITFSWSVVFSGNELVEQNDVTVEAWGGLVFVVDLILFLVFFPCPKKIPLTGWGRRARKRQPEAHGIGRRTYRIKDWSRYWSIKRDNPINTEQTLDRITTENGREQTNKYDKYKQTEYFVTASSS